MCQVTLVRRETDEPKENQILNLKDVSLIIMEEKKALKGVSLDFFSQ